VNPRNFDDLSNLSMLELFRVEAENQTGVLTGGLLELESRRDGSTPEQLETLADLSEEYADGVTHVTTRQDFQLHYVHIDDTPALMRRLEEKDAAAAARP